MERIKARMAETAPMKWLFLGDSITHGALHTFGWRDYVELFAERVRFEMGRGMDVVLNTAISGHTTRELLAGFDWRVAQFRPDVVLLMIGMNDCCTGRDIALDEFAENLRRLADQISELGAIFVMQTTCPILPGLSPDREPNFNAYMEAIRKVAAEKALLLVDHARYWEEHAAQHFYWMSNAFHPNEFGHRVFAQVLLQELGIFDPGSFTCRLFVP